MVNIEVMLTQIREKMLTLAIPESSFAPCDWVNARVSQYTKLLEKESIFVNHVFVQVNPKNFKDFMFTNSEMVTVESWEDVHEGTYRVEFETTNPSFDVFTGLFQGMFGVKDEVEIAWALWRTDYLNVDLASEIAKKLV